MQDIREELRRPKAGAYALTWRGVDGLSYSAEGRGVDISPSGVGIDCSRELKGGSLVRVECRDGSIEGDYIVVHCTRRGMTFRIGLEFREGEHHPKPNIPDERTDGEVDY